MTAGDQMAGRTQLEFGFANANAAPARKPGKRRRILLLGDYAGTNPGRPPLAARRIVPIDIDNLDRVLAHIAPHCSAALEGQAIPLDFREMEDFHPDSLYQHLPVFRQWRELRQRLQNPSTYPAAAAELQQGLGLTQATETVAITGLAAQDDAGLLNRLLGGNADSLTPAAKPPTEPIQALIAKLVSPHLDKAPDLSQQAQYLSAVDDALQTDMRQILHDSRFQGLEAVWRGTEWLIDKLADGEAVQAHLLDVSLVELMEDLIACGGQADKTAIFKLLTESSLAAPGGEAWHLTLGLYTFGEAVPDLALLEMLGAVSAVCGGSFMAAASEKLLGCPALAQTPDAGDWQTPAEPLAQAWHTLRRSAAADYIALALPRFLLRTPYGRQSSPTEKFRFEEMTAKPDHRHYLWGNPALACAELLARMWQAEDGGEGGDLRTTPALPLHVFDDGSGQDIKPCAEVYLNEKTAHAILDAGIIPLLSLRHQDRAIIPGLRSLATKA